MARPGLNRANVIAAAVRIVEKSGIDALTFARLARSLAVRPPSLYNHVESLEDVLDAVTARAFEELLEASREAILGRAGWDAIEDLARAQRKFARKRPGLYSATFRSLHGRPARAPAVADQLLGIFVAAMRDFELEEEDAIHAVRCLRAAIAGFIELELRGGFQLSVDVDESFRRMLLVLAAGIHEAREAKFPGRSSAAHGKKGRKSVPAKA